MQIRLGLIVIVCISGLLVSNVISLQVFDQDTVQGSGRVVYRESMIIFKADFEEGTYYDVADSGSGGGHARVDWSPNYNVAGSGSVVQTGNAKLSIQSDNVFNGDYASRHEFLTGTGGLPGSRVEVARWEEPEQYQEAYYGVAMYIPSSFDASLMYIMQISEGGLSPNIRCMVMLHKSGNQFYLRIDDKINGVNRNLWIDSQPFDTYDEWFTIVVHARWTEYGVIELFTGDASNPQNDLKRVTLAGDHRTTHGRPGCMMRTGIYGDTPGPTYLLVDDMTVATTYDDARPIRG